MDVRVLTVIFHVRSWKMRKKNRHFFLATMKNPVHYIDYHVKPYLCTKFGDFGDAEPPLSNLSEILG